jgi:hypothetical protein
MNAKSVACGAHPKALLLVLIACLTLASCTRSAVQRLSAGPGEFKFPVDTDSTMGPGSPLVEGFVVEDGSWLLGVPFPEKVVAITPANPHLGTQESTRWRYKWSALFAVTGNPETVAKRYLEQARRLGLTEGSTALRCTEADTKKSCVGAVSKPSDASEAGALRLQVKSVVDDQKDQRSGWPPSYLLIHGGGLGLTTPPEPTKVAAALTEGSPTPEPKNATAESAQDRPSSPAGKLPAPGERFGGAVLKVDGTEVREPVTFTVEPESHIVAPPAFDYGYLNDITTLPRGPGILTVVALDRPDAAAGYSAQARKRYQDETKLTQEWRWGEKLVRQTVLSEGGGGGIFKAISVTDENGRGYLLIGATTRS